MRKAALFCGGAMGVVLLCTVVWGKEEPGSRQTFGQRVNSLFGLIDRGEGAPPPPTPPDMPSYGRSRPQHVTVGDNSRRSVPHQPSPGAAAARMSESPTPPAPQRTTSGEAGLPPEVQQPQSRPAPGGLVQQSRSTTPAVAATTRPATTVPGSSRLTAATTASTSAGGYRSNVGTSAGASAVGKTTTTMVQAAPQAAAIQSALPRTTGGAPALPPAVMNSRRRQPGGSNAPVQNAVPATNAQNAADTAQPNLVAAPASAARRDKSEAFVPPDVFTADARAARPLNPATTVAPASPTVAQPPATAPEASPAITSSRRSAAVATASPLSQTSPAQTPIEAPPAASGPSLMSTPVPTPLPTAMSNASPPTANVYRNEPTPQFPTAQSGRNAAVLATFNAPEITVETLGPQRISIGREATYRVVVRNRGMSEAQQVVVSLGIPQWAEIADLHGTSGNTTSADEHAAGKPLEWRIESLGGRDEEELTLVLIPRRSEAFDLQVRWSCSPAAAATAIEVEEPQLRLAISGPTEVSYGEQRLYKLTVANPGTGTAENVQLHLMPLSAGDGDAVVHRIGDLAAGQDLSVEVELTARQAGRLQIRTEATAAGDLKAAAAADVVVHRAALDVLISAPKLLFAGVPGNYEVRVRNTGDDHARNVRVAVELPAGAKLLTANPAPRNESGTREITWTLDRLPAGAEQVYMIKCALGQGGTQQLTATAAADGDLRKFAQASTNVQAVADLVLDVLDTPGPIAVGDPVTFEIRVKNRGMKSAEGVDVVAFFSEGIEPENAEGHAFELQPGMVVFKTLSTLGANQERTFKITARATTGGNHRLRVELHSTNPQTDLSQEDSTFFYSDENTTVSSSGSSLPAPAMVHSDMTSSSATPAVANIAPGGPLPIITTANNAASTGAKAGDRYATPAVGGDAIVPYGGAANQAAPGAFAPVAASPINAGTSNAGPVTTMPAGNGSANAPAVIYPSAAPARRLSNDLR